MVKLRPNKALLFFLITVFLTVQWTATHIHLAEHHDHGGVHHQHNIHAHAASSHHADILDSIHAAGDYNVVELGNDCTSSGWKKIGDQLAVSISIAHQLLFVPKSSNSPLADQDSNKQSYITYSTIMLRAPPQFS